MSDASNPYESTSVKPPMPSGKMEYMRSIHYVFENPNWVTNVLLVGVCILSTGIIPVLGQLVCVGYQFGIIEALHRRPNAQYPDFDFNKLMDYLVRGFWIFLVGLVVGLAMLPIIAGLAVVFAVLVGGAGAAGGDDGAAVALIVVVPILFVAMLAIGIAINMISVPFMLRAGLMQDFGAAFDFGFAKQFIRNTWKEMILCALFSMVAGMLAALIGMAMLCVGIYFTMAVVMLMQGHLILQLYELHLARGGDAVYLKPEVA
ncbi:MAG: DUF4013 domain-containing protein [Planctomycetaceae bacterium]|nr:DUF4013 domain-containing protein [Planctomycetales bacterium]MCB9921430.1 DUF4013 domain-containing protein [Planctomycetaceae bacterium]